MTALKEWNVLLTVAREDLYLKEITVQFFLPYIKMSSTPFVGNTYG
jgi:hypothetical protein